MRLAAALATIAPELFPPTDSSTCRIPARRHASLAHTLEIEEIERSLIRGLIQQGAAY